MLVLKNIVKEYTGDGQSVTALKGVDIAFRRSEFVSILGPSGCGKTTMLNIIGGLDRYTDGDLVIDGVSTKKYKDADWDTYRNHKVGFVFQSYNLIPHQSVLANVELALTLSGVSRAERRQRAAAALEKVGLGDQIKKRPNQLSGGQMQRVAIARALVNDPEILLADEPTGALDTETSIQVMDILKEIAKDRLVIMVTHNPEIANSYSTRIVKLLDGRIIDDSDPYDLDEASKAVECKGKTERKTSMSLRTAFSLSLNNLMTKKRRTILTAFAGSIGIIGISLILSLSTGFQNYINSVEEETLTNYPITVEAETMDFSSLMTTLMGVQTEETEREDDKIYSSRVMGDMLSAMLSEVKSNDLTAFIEHIEQNEEQLSECINSVEYIYDLDLQIYSPNFEYGIVQVNPSTFLDKIMGSSDLSQMSSMASSMGTSMQSQSMGFDVFTQLMNNRELLESQYDVLSGTWPNEYNEVVLIVDKNNEISDIALYTLGLRDPSELSDVIMRIASGENFKTEPMVFSYDELIGLEFSLITPGEKYVYNDATGKWEDKSNNKDYMKTLIEGAEKLRIVGIMRPAEGSVMTASSGSIGYTPELMTHYMEKINSSEIVRQQLEEPNVDVFTGIAFPEEGAEQPEVTIEMVNEYISAMPEEEQAQITPYLSAMSEEQIIAMFTERMGMESTDATYDGNLKLLGVTYEDKPVLINIYPRDFESKDDIEAFISSYNDEMTAQGKEEMIISYTDYVGMLMSNVTKIIDTISYVLIAFVAISLIVSSIMIGVITNISVLERTKEIGILRSIGASKKDISHVFNAETFIVGFAAGIIGVGVTLLLSIPINALIKSLAGIENVAQLAPLAAVILIAISVVLTLVAGLIPAGSAARKDPVEALRTE